MGGLRLAVTHVHMSSQANRIGATHTVYAVRGVQCETIRWLRAQAIPAKLGTKWVKPMKARLKELQHHWNSCTVKPITPAPMLNTS